ncbi:MAG: CHAP domain-containing protein [Verrucomicrobiota bacterium]
MSRSNHFSHAVFVCFLLGGWLSCVFANESDSELIETATRARVLKAAEASQVKPGTPCTSFVEDVLKRTGFKISRLTSRQIQVDLKSLDELSDTSVSDKPLAALVEKERQEIQGVVNALLSSTQGRRVKIGELRPGDLVQYWYWTKKKKMGGHTAIVQKVGQGGKVTLIGSHRTYSPDAYVGELKVDLSTKFRVYAVRPKLSGLAARSAD